MAFATKATYCIKPQNSYITCFITSHMVKFSLMQLKKFYVNRTYLENKKEEYHTLTKLQRKCLMLSAS